MEFRLLGPIEAVDDGRIVDLGPRKQRALLCLLLLHANRVVPTDRILHELWGEDGATKEKALWVGVSRLRAALEPNLDRPADSNVLLTRDQGYVLQVDPDLIDLTQFETHIVKARRLNSQSPSEAVAHVDAALALWRGMPIEEFRDEEFARLDVARIDDLRLEALELRAESNLELGGARTQITELEALHEQNPLQERFVMLLMRSLYQAGRQADALRTFSHYQRTVGEELGIDASPELHRLEEQILLHDSAVSAVPVGGDDEAGPTVANPFKGLRAFQEADADNFFGRDSLVAELVDGLTEDASLLAVVGPSGSGKSSVVRAGLIPALRAGAVAGSEAWLIAQMVPGSHPFAELEAALLRSNPEGPDSLAKQISSNDSGLLRAVMRILPDDSATLLLVIDQFEELFTLIDDEETRRSFLANIATAMDDPHGRVKVVLTLRADFYDRPLQYPDFGARLSGSVVNVTPLSAEQLEAAALQPANRAGVAFEPALLAQLISDVGHQPGALPLFQYSLSELFDQRDGDTLKVASYREMGGVHGALGRRADEIYQTLDDTQRDVARQLFLRLVTLNKTGDHSRRRVFASEIVSLDIDTVTTSAVIVSFGRQRLLSFDVDQRSGAPTVEVAHEALLVSWLELATWIEESRDDIGRLANLRGLMDDWNVSERHSDYLVGGQRLDEFGAWERTSTVTLSAPEAEYLAAARTQHDAEVELEGQRRRREVRRLRITVAATAVGLVLALVAGAAAVVQSNRADDRADEAKLQATEAERQSAIAEERGDELERQATLTEARGTAASAISLQNQDPALALALAAESHGIFAPPPIEATNALVQTRNSFSSSPWQLGVVLPAPFGEVLATALSPNGQLLAVAGPQRAGEAEISIFDTASGQLAIPPITCTCQFVISAAFSPAGDILALGDTTGRVRLWDPATGAAIGNPLFADGAPVDAVAFSPDGSRLAAGDSAGVVQLWDVSRGGPSGEPFVTDRGSVTAVAFSPDGTEIAVAGGRGSGRRGWEFPNGKDGFLSIWRPATGELLKGDLTDELVLDVAFSPDGALLASAGSSADARGRVRLWDARTAAQMEVQLEDAVVIRGVRHVAFSPDSRLVVATGLQDLRTWDVSSGEAIDSVGFQSALRGSYPGGTVGFVAMRAIVAHASTLGVGIWRKPTGDSLGVDIDAQGGVLGLVYSPDGGIVATAGTDGALRFWNPLTFDEVAKPVAGGGAVGSVAFSPDSATFAAGGSNGRLWLGRTADNGVPAQLFAEQTGLIRALAFSPDGNTLAAAGEEQVLFWDPETGQSAGVPVVLPSTSRRGDRDINIGEVVNGLAFSADGRYLAIATASGDFIIREFGQASPLQRFDDHNGPVNAVSFSPDGRSLATASSDGTVQLWGVGTWERIGLPLNHPTGVEALDFSRDGRFLVSGDSAGSIYLWDAQTGRPLGDPMVGHNSAVRAVAFGPGDQIVSGANDGSLRFWDVLSVDRACELATPLITAEQLAAELGFDPQVCNFG